MSYILWVKPKIQKRYTEGYERETREDCEREKKTFDGFMNTKITNLDFKIEKV